MIQTSCCHFCLQFENSKAIRHINIFIIYSQYYSNHRWAWNTLQFYSCGHLQSRGKEKKNKHLSDKDVGKINQRGIDQYTGDKLVEKWVVDSIKFILYAPTSV